MHQHIGAPPGCVEVVITAKDADWLADLIRALVDDRLAACGQITDPLRTVYRRDGKVQDEPQARAALHTQTSSVSDIVDRIDRDHPGSVTNVVAMQLIDGNDEYLRWIVQETTPGAGEPVATDRDREGRARGRWFSGHHR